LGASLDESHEQGLILLKDIRPADQGDELRGCSLGQANAVVDIVAHLHAATWIEAGAPVPDGAERWMAQPWEQQRWGARVGKVRERYPGRCSEAVAERLVAMHTEVAEAIGGLVEGPVTWIHHDPHLDNVLWRPDGSPVLLDWSGARIAPPAIDVAGLLMSLAMCADAPLGPDQLLIEYVAALGRHGRSVAVEEVGRTAALALKLSIRGMVGWAGLVEEEPAEGRKLALRGDSVGRVLAAIRWLDR
jgi:aminoglycoside phosphotransferase (APT) family kinase protein